MLFAGLGDIIDDTDPCTLNPSDPICQAFGPTSDDPCAQDPTLSFCQQAIVNAVSAGNQPPDIGTFPPAYVGSTTPQAASITFPFVGKAGLGTRIFAGLAAVGVLVGGVYLVRKMKRA